MSEQEVRKLEYLVDDLLKACEHLKQENSLLRERQEVLFQERTKLIEKNELACTRIESMIVRLKAQEHA
ncbi:MAG: TIGR02449 family protein [Gammaproteobacteria bacterium]|nr:TIGR02449 family protein [Gammaproteobacteria bacterium]MCF6230761.1 TIGR02449 family protein [Gammaproteobacteria bacterium]